jgi:hypothetical protein
MQPVLVLALLALLSPAFSYAQSLGDVAREARTERQKSGVPHPKVITNEDLAEPAAAQEVDVSKKASAQNPAADAGHRTVKQDSDKEKAELEAEKRTAAINKSYLERIGDLRRRITAAQLQVEKLKGEYMPIYSGPEAVFNAQPALAWNQRMDDRIKAQIKLIDGLKSKLEDLQEEARHAGVPHATD